MSDWRGPVLGLMVVALAHGSAQAQPAPDAAARPANVVVILADDLGYADVGFQGCRDIPTPNLDRLARSGVRCTSGYVSHPFCSPTRAGLLTGRYQQRFGHENNPRYDPNDPVLGLPRDQTTIADVLSQAGYATGWVGKWHLGATPDRVPARRGFTDSFGFLGGGHDYFKAEGPDAREYLIPIRRDGMAVEEPEYLTDALAREAAAFVERHRERPFFLYLAFNAPHTPLQAPEADLGRFAAIADPKRRAYAAMVAALDRGVGRLREAIEQGGLRGRTLVVFLSDNGGPPTANGSSNLPLRSGKGSVYEGGIRVPFVVSWPGRLPSGTTYIQPVSSLDLFATALGAAGVAKPEGMALDGVDLVPHLEGKDSRPPHESLFWRTGGGATWAVRSGRYKALDPGTGTPELYDLDADPSERKDLAAAEPGRLAGLLEAQRDWNAQLVPPLWENPPPAAAKARGKAATKKAAPTKAAAPLP